MIVEIGPLENSDGSIKCSHPRCDGRPAKWDFPQTATRKRGRLRSCSVHIARMAEIILRDQDLDVLRVKSHDCAA